MIRLELWDKNSDVIDHNCSVKAPEQIMQEYPFTRFNPTVLEFSGSNKNIDAIDDLNTLRHIYRIDPLLSETDAVTEIERLKNAPPEINPEAAPMTKSDAQLLGQLLTEINLTMLEGSANV